MLHILVVGVLDEHDNNGDGDDDSVAVFFFSLAQWFPNKLMNRWRVCRRPSQLDNICVRCKMASTLSVRKKNSTILDLNLIKFLILTRFIKKSIINIYVFK